MSPSSFPVFLGIGAQRSGTTWLHRNLRKHPQIWMPLRKELHFFDRANQYLSSSALSSGSVIKRVFTRSQEGSDSRRTVRKGLRASIRQRSSRRLRWELKYLFGRHDALWYASLFEEGRGSLCGEVTPTYMLLNPEDIRYIHQLMPEAKIILLVRNPVERAWSHARFSLRHRPKRRKASLDRFYRWHFQSEGSRGRGDFVGALERWQEVFAKEQIFIGFYDDLKRDPAAFLQSVYRYLNVDSSLLPSDAADRVEASRGTEDGLPAKYRELLNAIYYPQLCLLSEKLGGWCEVWRREAEETVACGIS